MKMEAMFTYAVFFLGALAYFGSRIDISFMEQEAKKYWKKNRKSKNVSLKDLKKYRQGSDDDSIERGRLNAGAANLKSNIAAPAK